MAPWNMCPAFWRASFLLFLYTLCFFLAATSRLSVSFFLLLVFVFIARAFVSLVAPLASLRRASAKDTARQAKRSGTRHVCDNFLMFHCLQLSSCPIAMSKLYIINFLAASESFHDFLLSGVLVILRWLCRACPLICIKMFTNIFIFITMEIKGKQRRKYSNWL